MNRSFINSEKLVQFSSSLRYFFTLFSENAFFFCFGFSLLLFFFRLSLYLPWLIYSCFVVAFFFLFLYLFVLNIVWLFPFKFLFRTTFFPFIWFFILLFFLSSSKKNLGCARICILRPMWFHVRTSALYFVKNSVKRKRNFIVFPKKHGNQTNLRLPHNNIDINIVIIIKHTLKRIILGKENI